MGISSTKVVAFVARKLNISEIWEGGFSLKHLEEFIAMLNASGRRVKKIVLTGVGSKKFSGNLLGYPTVVVDEFVANAASAHYLCDKPEYLVASLGTGTSFVHVTPEGSTHIGGSALGGGTVLGLFQQLVTGGGWAQLRALAARGTLDSVDLTVADVSDVALPDLPLDTTVTNFGKVGSHSTPQDLTLGLINMVLQNIGVMAYLAGSARGIRDIVVIGRMSTLPYADEIFARLNRLYGVNFILADKAAYMTALGAVISCSQPSTIAGHSAVVPG